MTQTRSEQLFEMLFDTIDELSELESSDVIFDSIVDHLAEQTEYHMGQANAFRGMLNTFRHDNPAETIPEVTGNVDIDVPHPSLEDLYGGVSDINRQYMLEDRDTLMDFLRTAHFPDTLDS